jgi:hypothetical protein
MRAKLFCAVLVGITIMVALSMNAQNLSSAQPSASSPNTTTDSTYHGLNGYESFSGLIARSGALLKLDSSVGYDFSRNFGIFAGVPLYFTNSFEPSSSGTLRASGLGDAYIGAELYTFSKLARYSTSVTMGIPTGDAAKGFSPGTVTADWTNRFRHSFGRLTPAFSVGVGNTLGVAIGGLPSSALVDGSLGATGAFVHMEEGAEFDLTRRVYIGGEGYHVLPFGSLHAATGGQGSDVSAASSILPENGFDTWINFQPNSLWDTEVGYSRSATFALNSFSFRVGLNVGRMIRSRNSARQ